MTTTTTPGRVEFLNPDGLVRNPAFTHVAVVSGAVKTIYIGGQDAITADGEIVGKGDLAGQTTQVLRNIETALTAAGAGIEHVVKLNILIVDGQDFRARLRRLPGGVGQSGQPCRCDRRHGCRPGPS